MSITPALLRRHLLRASLRSKPFKISSHPRLPSQVSPTPCRRQNSTSASSRPSNPIAPPTTPPKIRLRDYQEASIASVLAAVTSGSKRVGISLATGAGKTVIFTQLIARVPTSPSRPEATQTLILAHRRELVEQAAKHCTLAYPGATIDVEMGALHASGTADITVASIQSLTSGDRIAKFDPARFKLVLVDEAHHIVAPGYMRALEHFGLDKKRASSPVLVGVSATFSRFDGLRLGAAIDEIVYHRDYVDMIEEKWLSGVVFTTVESSADISRVRSGGVGKDFQPGELSKAVNTEKVNEITVRSWMARAKGRKSTLVFCVDLAHVAGLTAKFRAYGIDAQFVTGDTHKVERSERLEAFKKGEFPVLINCGVFTEGTDIPNIDCVILARPTKSRNLLIQMIGRGMRLFPGKENCHVIDMVSSLQTGIVTTPTLFGLDPGELVKEASVDDLTALKERKEAEARRKEQVDSVHDLGDIPTGVMPKKITFTDYDSVFDLIADTSGEKHIRSISQYAWVQVNDSKYILSGPTGTYIKLEREGPPADVSVTSAINSPPLFRAYVVQVLPPEFRSKSPYAKPRPLLSATTFADAVHGADSYAAEHFAHAFISRRQAWRDGPPTQGQLDMLNKLRPDDEKLSSEDLTKGKAMDMITKMKHGARGRFAGIAADKRKRERKVVMEEAMKGRERVSVGPLAG